MIITDATEHWKARNWTPEHLAQIAPQAQIEAIPTNSRTLGETVPMTLKEYVDYFQAPDERKLYIWFEWVDSEGNWADGASRIGTRVCHVRRAREQRWGRFTIIRADWSSVGINEPFGLTQAEAHTRREPTPESVGVLPLGRPWGG